MSPTKLSDDKVGPPAYALIEPTLVHDSDRESQEESLRTPIDLEEEQQYEETHTNRRQEHRDANGTTPMTDDLVSRIIEKVIAA